MLGGQAFRYAVCPLDQANPVSGEVFVRSQVGKLGGVLEAIGVEVIDRQASVIFLDQDKCGTIDGPAVGDIESLGNGANEVSLAGTKRADQGNDGAGK